MVMCHWRLVRNFGEGENNKIVAKSCTYHTLAYLDMFPKHINGYILPTCQTFLTWFTRLILEIKKPLGSLWKLKAFFFIQVSPQCITCTYYSKLFSNTEWFSIKSLAINNQITVNQIQYGQAVMLKQTNE